MEDCIKSSQQREILSSRNKVKISKKDMLCTFQNLFSTSPKKLNDLNQYDGDYHRGVLPTMLKLCYFANYSENRKQLKCVNVLYSDLNMFVYSVEKYIVVSFKMSQEYSDWNWKKNLK
ncbi:MAG: hypothetical protein HN879_09780 [Flavobacteriaceae bacterium]|nr:hypothetical protein [Flavobacteriaceae bacterium]